MLPTVSDLSRKKKKNRHGEKWPDTQYHPQLSTGSASQKEHLLLQLNTAAAGLALACCWIHVRVWLCLYICSLRMPADSTTPTLLSLGGWPGGCWERGTCAALSIIPLGSSGGGWAGRTAAAVGSRWTCWLSQECPAQPLSRVLCCRLCQTFADEKIL